MQGTLTPTTALLQNVAALVTSYSHSCAILTSGEVQCWGENFDGGLGLPGVTSKLAPTTVPLPAPARALALGAYHTCVVLVDGRPACWGFDDNGAVGDGMKVRRDSPFVVPGIGDALAVAAGYQHTCVLRAGGAIQCWGANGSGQLGDGTTNDSPTPVTVVGMPRPAIDVCGGQNNACALDANHGVYCWGQNYEGEIGDGTYVDRSSATPVTGLASGVVELACGFTVTCARMMNDSVQCWGTNTYGALGDGSTASHRPTPGPVSLP
jgi:alpha-tubulin suppressor-like RCC1 family protein